jgi:hypothetical protein
MDAHAPLRWQVFLEEEHDNPAEIRRAPALHG